MIYSASCKLQCRLCALESPIPQWMRFYLFVNIVPNKYPSISYVIQHLLCVNDNSTCRQTISSCACIAKTFPNSMNCRRMKNSLWCILHGKLAFCPTSSNTFSGANVGQRSPRVRGNNGNTRVCQNSALLAASQIFCQKSPAISE